MADAALKPEKDFSKEAEKVIPEAQQLAKSDLNAAIEKLAVLEKQTRQASDLASLSKTLIAIVTIAKDAGKWSLLNDQVLILSKKHGQLKQAITRMVQTVMTFIDSTPDLETKLTVIETLRTVTEGKIFVEVERARVTKILSDIKKQQGDLKAATDILCELQVETFGSMDRRERQSSFLPRLLCASRTMTGLRPLSSRAKSARDIYLGNPRRRPSSWLRRRSLGKIGAKRAKMFQKRRRTTQPI